MVGNPAIDYYERREGGREGEGGAVSCYNCYCHSYYQWGMEITDDRKRMRARSEETKDRYQ